MKKATFVGAVLTIALVLVALAPPQFGGTATLIAADKCRPDQTDPIKKEAFVYRNVLSGKIDGTQTIGLIWQAVAEGENFGMGIVIQKTETNLLRASFESGYMPEVGKTMEFKLVDGSTFELLITDVTPPRTTAGAKGAELVLTTALLWSKMTPAQVVELREKFAQRIAAVRVNLANQSIFSTIDRGRGDAIVAKATCFFGSLPATVTTDKQQ